MKTQTNSGSAFLALVTTTEWSREDCARVDVYIKVNTVGFPDGLVIAAVVRDTIQEARACADGSLSRAVQAHCTRQSSVARSAA